MGNPLVALPSSAPDAEAVMSVWHVEFRPCRFRGRQSRRVSEFVPF
jgi:hypothetical protein